MWQEKLKVLIADDHPLIMQTLVNMLQTEPGIEIVGTVTDGNEVVTQTLQLKPDVILMDMNLPHISGRQATLLIKRQYPAVQVILLSGSFREDELLEAHQAGAERCLLHSATVHEVLDAVYHIARQENNAPDRPEH